MKTIIQNNVNYILLNSITILSINFEKLFKILPMLAYKYHIPSFVDKKYTFYD